jgi:hypothetical protein
MGGMGRVDASEEVADMILKRLKADGQGVLPSVTWHKM